MMMVVMMIKVAKSFSVIMAHIIQLTSAFYILPLTRGIFFKVHIFLNGRRRHDLPVHKKTHIKAEQSTIQPPLTNSS